MADFGNFATNPLPSGLPSTMAETSYSSDVQARIDELNGKAPAIPVVTNTDPQGKVIGPVLSRTAQQTMGDAMAYGLPALGIGAIDSLGSSIGVWGDDTVQNAITKLSPNGLGDFYARNKTAFQAAGDIGTSIVLPAYVGGKLIQSARWAREGGKLGEWLKNSAAVDALLGSSVKLSNMESRIADAARNATAKFGVFSGKTFASDVAVNSAKASYYKGKIAESVRQSVAFEASFRFLYNDSETLFPADYTLSDQLKWGGTFAAGAAALDLVVGRYAVRKVIQAAAKDRPLISQWAQDIDKAMFRPGDRGVGLTQFAALTSDLKARVETAADQTTATNLRSDISIAKATQVTQLNAMAGDIHVAIPRTTLGADREQLLMGALEKDETSVLYATKLGDVPSSTPDFYKELTTLKTKSQAAVEKAKTEFSSVGTKAGTPLAKQQEVLDALRAKVKEAELANEEQHYVFENDSTWSVFGTRSPKFLDESTLKDIKRQTYVDDTLIGGQPSKVRRSFLQAPGFNFKLHDNFVLEIPKTETAKEWSAVYAAGTKLVKDYRPVEGQRFVLNEKMSAFQVEGTLALAAKYPEVANNIIYSGKFHNASDAAFHVVDQKYQTWLRLMDNTERQAGGFGVPVLNKIGSYTPEEVTSILNLPKPIGAQAHPLIKVFTQAKLQKMKSLEELLLPSTRDLTTPNRGIDMLQQTMREAAEVSDPAKIFALDGGLLAQKDVRPVFVAAKTVPTLSRSDQVLHNLIEAKRNEQLRKLSTLNDRNAPLVSKVVAVSANLGATNQARQVQDLSEGVLAGRGIFTAQDRLGDQEPVFKAASLVTQETESIIEKHVGDLMEQSVTPLVNKVRQPKNYSVLVDANRGIHAYQFGWDIKNSIKNADGSTSFILNNDSKINKELFERYFSGDEGVSSTDDLMMPDMSITGRKNGYFPLKIHSDAGELLDNISRLSKGSGYENNAIRWAAGEKPVKIRDFHLPTPSLGREGTWFVKNSADKVVATYSGGIASQNRKLAEEAATSFSQDGEKHLVVSLDDVRRQHNIFDDDAFFNMIDYSDQLRKDGRGISGGLAKAQIDTTDETLKAMISSLTAQYLNVGTRARALLFEPELNYAKQASEVAGLSNHFKELNVWDRYRSIVYNTTPRSRQGAVTQVYNAVENLADAGLSFAYAHTSEFNVKTPDDKKIAQGLKNLVYKSTSENLYKQYQKNMSDWSPFHEAQDWIESTYQQKATPQVRTIMAQIARVSSTMSLRFLDAGTSILNMASLATNAPGVLAALRPMKGEDLATEAGRLAHQSRTASWGIQWKPGITTFSATKAMTNVTKALFDGSLVEPLAEAARRGVGEPEFAALAKAFAQTNTGDKNYFHQLVEKGSWLADSSERLSRLYSWGMGYKIAKDLGKFEDEGNAFIFARQFANDMIGNYSPKNKPIMFQGALGTPLGSFQTYMFNWYRRIFGYIERKDYRALAATYAAQASIFGAKSVPGFGAFNNGVLGFGGVLNDPTSGDTLDTRIRANLPDTAYELLMHGTLSNIPAIFGEGGIALYTRGSVDLTQLPPTPLELTRSPPFQFLSNTATGIQQTIQNVLGAGGFSLQQQEEILANFSTNRAVKNIMEQAANAKTDARGNVIELSTRDMIHWAAGIAGSRPTNTQNIMDAYNSERQVELAQEALRAKLNVHTRSMMRGGEFGIDELQGVVEDYLHAHGNPAYLGEWLRNTAEVSVTPRSERKLKELLSSKKGVEFVNMITAIQQN